MEAGEVHLLLERVVGDVPVERGLLLGWLGDVCRLRSWLDGREIAGTQQLSRLSSFPEHDAASAAHSDLRAGMKAVERAETVAAMPLLGDGLGDGGVTVEHVDVVAGALRQLDTDVQRQTFAGRAAMVVEAARRLTPGELQRRLRDEVRGILADDGLDRYRQQQRATRLRTWVDQAGMGRIAGEFDPLTFATFETRLRQTMDTLFAEHTPTTCPTDPLAKQDHLRALALIALTNSNSDGRGGGRPEFVVVIDTTQAAGDGTPSVEFAIPVEVPWRVLAEFSNNADIHPVIVRNGIVLHPPDELNLGRTTRIANRRQRRILRALHQHCIVPDCAVRFDLCDIHHVIWWRHGGLTELANLVPICARHHQQIHQHGWQLTLHADRSIELRLPDGQILTTGPPRQHAA